MVMYCTKHNHGMVHKIIRVLFMMVIIILLLVFILMIYYWADDRKLTVTHYSVTTNLPTPLRITHLTDLHNAEFGEHNRDLIVLVQAQSPDLIVMTGDMINKDDTNLEIICRLIQDLSQIADVYYGLGNHETSWISSHGDSLESRLTEAGAIVLNNDYIDVDLNDNQLRIAGYMGYYGAVHMTAHTVEAQQAESNFIKEFQDTDRYKILLNHIPTAWVDWKYTDKYPVNLVFSGHYHGGLIRIPLLDRGLYAPYVGWFPPYTKGLYTGTEATCILSAGLGSEYNIPRLNNPPEIIVTDLIPKQDSPATE